MTEADIAQIVNEVYAIFCEEQQCRLQPDRVKDQKEELTKYGIALYNGTPGLGEPERLDTVKRAIYGALVSASGIRKSYSR